MYSSPFGRCLTVLVFGTLIVSVGTAGWAQSETPRDTAENTLSRHLDQLEKGLAQRVATAVGGSYERQSWQDLRRHYLRLSADLEAGDPSDLRLRRALRELNELEGLVEDPQALKAHFRRLRSRSSVGELDTSEKIDSGRITGRVIGSGDGMPLASAEVIFSNYDFFNSVFTDENGFYELSLPAGTYTVSAWALRYQEEVYDNIPCDFDCFFPNGDLVDVAVGQTVANIDFSLESLGRVTGQAVDQSSGIPLEGISVTARVMQGLHTAGFTQTEADGSYVLEGLEPGDYWIVASGEAYQTEAFDGVPCSFTYFGLQCSEPAQNVSAEVGVTTEDVDFSLERRGSISGRVTSAVDGQGMPFVRVLFEPVGEDGILSEAYTDSEGEYQSPGLNAGGYLVYTQNFEYFVNEIYDNVPCNETPIGLGCDDSQGAVVQVDVDTATRNIDFELELGGTLSGTVTQTVDGLPIEFAEIRVYDSNDQEIANVYTEPDGTYELMGLNAGQYALRAFSAEYVVELYDNIACPLELCPLPEADRVTAQYGVTTSGVDFELDRQGVIEGRVIGLESGEPIELAVVSLYDSETGMSVGSRQADAQGFFRMSRLQPGSYRMTVEDINDRYITLLYPDISCGQGNCDFSLGGTVEVELNSTAVVEINLKLGAIILADIRDRATGLPSEQGDLTVYDASGYFAGSGSVSQDGGYVVSGLASGQYYLVASGYFFGHQVYGGDFCIFPATCDPRSGNLISVVEGGESPRIDFEVDFNECQFADSDLCLATNRMRAVVKWRDSSGNEGYGSFYRLSNDSGYFWFFDSENIEGVVKVLNACSQPVDRYWVFAAGLTDLEVTLWITDFISGQTRTYTKPGGQAFQPIQDTNAFATCPGTTGLGSDPDEVGLGSMASTQGQALAGTPVSAAAKACDSASGRLCLNGGRFAVEAFYQAPGQPEQLAGASTLTSESGYFYFFDPDNVEVLVKVLDSCTFSDRFWVFGAGLTNVRVRLVVTDTESGEVQEYVNEQGDAFVPIQDTQAFATCF